MDIFILLMTNLLPLYLIIGAGFFAGKYLGVDRQMLANVGLYICVPVVIFGFVVHLDLRPAYALLPVLMFGAGAIIGYAFLLLGKRVFGDGRANLMAVCACMGNTGYFGLPLVILLVEPEWVGVYMFMLLGYVIYEGTLGYYIVARGRFSVQESLRRLIKFPAIYAVIAGIAYNLADLSVPQLFDTYWTHFKGAYIIIGMMVVGSALAKVQKFGFDPVFLGLSFAGKFIAWPGLCLLLIALDQHILHFFNPEIYKLFIIMAVVPQAANIAAFAAQNDLHPEQAATTVLLGTVFALFYIPLALTVLGFA